MSLKTYIAIFIFSIFALDAVAQATDRKEKITINGEIVTALITDEGDTLLIADLDDVFVSSPRTFKDKKEEWLYNKYRRYAVKVYPYAVKSIKIFREVEEGTKDMSRRKRRKHIKKLSKQLKKEFNDPLKNLSKTQGKILIKMIEKELDTPFYTLLKNLRGGFTAAYYSGLGRLYGYKLKRGYVEGDDRILDMVLQDFDISHKQ